MRIHHHFILQIVLVVFAQVITLTQPTRPFPQHTHYVAGTIKPNNFTQQQLDDSTVAFYNRWKSRYLKHDCGADQYYVFDDEKAPIICVSEGQGYGMLITAIMAGYDILARTYFDGLYRFSRAHRSHINPNLMAWKEVTGCLTDSVDGTDAATDGDLDIAFALLLAHEQWGSDGTIDYQQEASTIIDAIMQDEINPVTQSVKLGDWAFASDPTYYYGTRTSDFMMDHFRVFQQFTDASSWTEVIDRCYSLIAAMQTNYSSATGLLPDFIVHCNTTPQPAPPNYLEASTDGSYSYNACRDPWRIATDYLMSGDPRAKAALDKLNSWIRAHTGGDPSKIRAGYHLNGSNIPGTDYSAESFTGPFAASAMVDSSNQQWLNDLWTFNLSYNFDSAFYYENTLKLLTIIVVSGNWWQPEPKRTIAFSGFTWQVKTSIGRVRPGPNYFSNNPQNVWVDSIGQLHMKIAKRSGRWYCSEVYLDTSLGHGRYVFYSNTRLDHLDPNVVLGLFTWDDNLTQAHREIDIEVARWGDPFDTTNAQFVVQPWESTGHLMRWTISDSTDSATHSFDWHSDSINFLSVQGHHAFPPYEHTNAAWTYHGAGIPSPGFETAHMNLWLDAGNAPSDSQDVEIVIAKFEFNPTPLRTPRRWQMVSLPRRVTDASVRTIFPDALSKAFSYAQVSGYQGADTLTQGKGYWIKFPTSEIPIITGDSVLVDTIDVAEGWNMIGSISIPVAVHQIGSIPGGLISSEVFGYADRYAIADTMQPGRGYWIKASNRGSLVLSSSSGTSAFDRIKIVSISELPPLPPDRVTSHPTSQISHRFALEQNYPNPFNPVTNFQFSIANLQLTILRVYNVLGQEVATLVNDVKPPGVYTVTWDATKFPSGVYYCRMQAGGFVVTKKLILLK